MAATELDDPGRGVTEFAHLYAGLSRRVIAYFVRRGFDDHAALDLAGDTFAVAFEQRRGFRGSSQAEQEAWIFAIARSQLARHARRGLSERRRFERAGLDLAAAGDREMERIVELSGSAMLRARVALALAALPAAQRRALEGHVVHERSYGELAREWGISEEVVRARVSRGLRALATVVTDPPAAGS